MPKDYTTQGCKDLGFKGNGAVMPLVLWKVIISI